MQTDHRVWDKLENQLSNRVIEALKWIWILLQDL